MKKYIAAILTFNIILASCPLSALAQTVPQTTEEAKTFGLNLLERLPDAIKNVWCNQVLPLWQKAWAWIKSFWDNTLGAKVEMLWQKFLGLLGKESPDVKEEFQKESEEMQKDIWQRFKELF